MPSVRQMLRSVLDVLIPASCPLCGKDLPCVGDVLTLCDDCESQDATVSEYCRRCSAAVGPFVETQHGCRHCRRDRFAFARVFSAAEYRGIMRSAVLRAKRITGGPAAAWLADRLWERRGSELTALPIDLVVPVPQHWTRRLVAPHNTAELIARRLAFRLKSPLDVHRLTKVRRTPPQASLSPTARRANLRQAFVAIPVSREHRILLVDDVLTTGTTADRASRVLLDAGADTVWVAAAARGIGA